MGEENIAGSAGSKASAAVDPGPSVYGRLESHIIFLRSENMTLRDKVEELLDQNTGMRKQIMDAFDKVTALEEEVAFLMKKVGIKQLQPLHLHSVSPTHKG